MGNWREMSMLQQSSSLGMPERKMACRRFIIFKLAYSCSATVWPTTTTVSVFGASYTTIEGDTSAGLTSTSNTLSTICLTIVTPRSHNHTGNYMHRFDNKKCITQRISQLSLTLPLQWCGRGPHCSWQCLWLTTSPPVLARLWRLLLHSPWLWRLLLPNPPPPVIHHLPMRAMSHGPCLQPHWKSSMPQGPWSILQEGLSPKALWTMVHVLSLSTFKL